MKQPINNSIRSAALTLCIPVEQLQKAIEYLHKAETVEADIKRLEQALSTAHDYATLLRNQVIDLQRINAEYSAKIKSLQSNG